jgi:two-component system OmpR family response regulator
MANQEIDSYHFALLRSPKQWPPDHMLAMVKSNPTTTATDFGSGHILVVDDDPAVRLQISDYFGQHGIQTVTAPNRSAAICQLAATNLRAVVLDLRSGNDGGFDLLREIRSSSDVPVILLTARSGDEVDCVVGLELGADDCLVKPFGVRELYARFRALLRRHEARARARAPGPEWGVDTFGGWRLDRRSRRLTDPQQRPVSLSKSEYGLLLAFLDSPQRPLSREYLLQATRMHEDIFDRSIDVQVLRLRRKLEADPKAPRIIKTERGVGYVFAIPVERAAVARNGLAYSSTVAVETQMPGRMLVASGKSRAGAKAW